MYLLGRYSISSLLASAKGVADADPLAPADSLPALEGGRVEGGADLVAHRPGAGAAWRGEVGGGAGSHDLHLLLLLLDAAADVVVAVVVLALIRQVIAHLFRISDPSCKECHMIASCP